MTSLLPQAAQGVPRPAPASGFCRMHATLYRFPPRCSDSRDSRGSVGPDPSAGEVGSKGSKGRKSVCGAKSE